MAPDDDFTGDENDPFEALLLELAAAPEVPVPLAPKVGDVLAGRYRILEPLGSGAMGNVYRVADQHLDEDVALKLLHPRLAARSRHDSLRTEVRMARRIAHPNVCRVHDLGSEGERLFVTMELLGGRTLREWIGRRREIGLSACIDILVQVASGLAAAHRAGVIHGDVKPDNVILDRERAVLTDFGIARPLSQRSGEVELLSSVAGTPAYMAPELLANEPADRRVDTYSFGVLAFELLVGERPALIGAGTSSDPKTASLPDDLPTDVAEPEIRRALLAVLRRATARVPAERPDPIGVLASLLSRAANGEIPISGRRRRPRTHAPHRVVTALHVRVADGLQPSTPPRFDGEDLERLITNLSGVVVSANDRCLEAVFGAPRTIGGEALRAARAALAIAKQLSYAAVGVHTGTVELSATGGGSPLASGEALATARAVASNRGVICSAVAGAQLAGHFDLTRRSDGSFNLHRGLPAVTAVANTMHGREAELAELGQRFASAFAQRRTGVVRIVGPAGIGKTRLVHQFVRNLRSRRDVDVIRADAAPYADAGPLAQLRGELGADASHQELRARLLARAAHKPCLLVVDDLQWADSGSRDFLAELENVSLEAALGCVFIARDQASLWPPGSMTQTIELGGLTDADVSALVGDIAPELSPDQLATVLNRAQGNPLLAAELGRAVETGRSLPSSAIAAAQELCDALGTQERDLIARAAAYGASFATGELYWSELRALEPASATTATTRAAADIAAVELVKRGLLQLESRIDSKEAEPIRYRFVSPLVREVVYEQTPIESRLSWHLAYADHLESDATEPTVERLSALAQHLERGGQSERAGAAYARAGARALERNATSDAAGLLVRALEFTDQERLDAELLTNLGLAVQDTDGATAEEHFYHAFSLTSSGDEIRPRLCHYLGTRAAGRSDNLAARTWYQRGLDEVRDLDQHRGKLLGASPPLERTVIRALLLASLGSLVGYDLNDPTAGLEMAETAVKLLESTGHNRELATALASLGGNYMRMGRWLDQLNCNQRNLDIAIELGDSRAELRARINLGVVQCNLGRLDEAIDNTRASFNLAVELGDSVSRSLALHNLGMLLVETGDLDGGVERLEAAIELGRRVGYDRFLDESYACLSRVAFLRGDFEVATQQAHSAVGVSVASGSEISEGISLRFLAAPLARQGNVTAALEHLCRAHQCLSQRDRYEDCRTSVVEARILRARGGEGDAGRATVLLESARKEFERLGAIRDLSCLNDEGDLR